MKLSVPEMNCGHCKASVEQAIAGLDSAAKVSVDLPARTVMVETSQPEASVIAALGDVGFDAVPMPA